MRESPEESASANDCGTSARDGDRGPLQSTVVVSSYSSERTHLEQNQLESRAAGCEEEGVLVPSTRLIE